MAVDAYVLRHKFEQEFPFIASFLGSPDFDNRTLQSICQEIGKSYGGSKPDLAQRIAEQCIGSQAIRKMIMQYLVGRDKGWFSVKTGRVLRKPECDDPAQLLLHEGERKWYGPIDYPSDSSACWYIRPEFLPHWEVPDDSTQVMQYSIRWLCFARVVSRAISLHWRGFSHADSASALEHNSQFRYWEYVPGLFEEIEELTGAMVDSVNLHRLVLHELWDRYRYDPSYRWLDRRIRAESGGVSLSAHAGPIVEIEVAGIRRLAYTIRCSIEQELGTQYNIGVPEPEGLDEVILRTLLREFGALSYEFSLGDKDGNRLFRAHNYFGLKPETTSADSFPHSRVFTTWQNDLDQLHFLLHHLGVDDGNEGEFTQPSLF